MQLIIQHKGVFNLYDTVTNKPIYTPGLQQWQLNELVRQHLDERERRALPHRIQLAREQGTDMLRGDSLFDLIKHNQAGEDGEALTREQFIKIFLTLRNLPIRKLSDIQTKETI